uniref:SDR family NAD(P)-dependent oxidoreductase n=1 Tax=Heterorhabditis bacteriophora TaxID=37862 RepID=A0A1I7XJD2_HETBA
MKPIFITGCDSGFGRALAIKCAQRGMPVFAGCQFNEVWEDITLLPYSEK